MTTFKTTPSTQPAGLHEAIMEARQAAIENAAMSGRGYTHQDPAMRIEYRHVGYDKKVPQLAFEWEVTPEASPEAPAHVGIRVIDGDGAKHEYPDADGTEELRGMLYVIQREGEDGKKTLALFRYWNCVERIA